jgi:hypothetical protein
MKVLHIISLFLHCSRRIINTIKIRGAKQATLIIIKLLVNLTYTLARGNIGIATIFAFCQSNECVRVCIGVHHRTAAATSIIVDVGIVNVLIDMPMIIIVGMQFEILRGVETRQVVGAGGNDVLDGLTGCFGAGCEWRLNFSATGGWGGGVVIVDGGWGGGGRRRGAVPGAVGHGHGESQHVSCLLSVV